MTSELKAEAREILNRHTEYMNGLDRGQVTMRTSNALAAVEEALTRHPAPLSEENVESSDHPAFEAICDEISRFAPEVSTGMRGFLAARIIMQMLAQPAPQSHTQGGSN